MIFLYSKRQFNFNWVWFLHVFMVLQLSQKPKKAQFDCVCVICSSRESRGENDLNFAFVSYSYLFKFVWLFFSNTWSSAYTKQTNEIWVLHNLRRSKHIACNKQIYSLPLQLSKLSKMINDTNCLLYIYSPSLLGDRRSKRMARVRTRKTARGRDREGVSEKHWL